jgi:hypothetical protein
MQQQTLNPTLKQLDALVGEWEMQASIGGQPLGKSRARFEWLEGGAFLVEHADTVPANSPLPPEWVANSPFPITTLFGLDDATERFCMLYADNRGLFRIYQMSIGDGVWKVWRDAPGFFQRFTGTFGDDGSSITAYWEWSSDGSTWERDFDLEYTKVASY